MRSGKNDSYIPERGDIIWIDFDPQAGREQKGRRVALVLSPSSYNGLTGLLVACPITNTIKGYSFEVGLPSQLQTTGVVLADHIKSLDWRSRDAEFRESAPDTLIREVYDMVTALLDPDQTGTEADDQ